jgi:dipeptidyl aminopeptidase/acylaminoacyl peptidase
VFRQVGRAALWPVLLGTVLLSGCRPGAIWSPDGKLLALETRSGLFRFDVERGSSELLVGGARRAINPSWSPDGKRLCFYLAAIQGERLQGVSLAALDLQTRKQQVLVARISLPQAEKGPPGASPLLLLKQVLTSTWSPDGKQVAFITHEGGRSVLGVVSSAGGAVKRLTSPPHEALSPAWSPDGTQIAYLIEKRGKPGPGGIPASHGPLTLHLIRPDGTGARKWWTPPAGLALNPVPLGPQWSRDGKSVGLIAEVTPAGGAGGAEGGPPTTASEAWSIPVTGPAKKVAEVPGAAIGASYSADLRAITFYLAPPGGGPNDPNFAHPEVAVLREPFKTPQTLFRADLGKLGPDTPPDQAPEGPPIPAVSPDGTQVALLEEPPGKPARLRLIRAGEREPRVYPLPAPR